MNLLPVSSSRMNGVGYENNTMYIQFKDGSIYAYENVSESDYRNFINSPSLGSALSRFDKIHPYHRV
ncbi:KTSC domain-containing protein [Clostridium scatologenes]|uniref:Phage protein n=1 Tax=Clostridium scatologenes TaxID=1548 RepID=A0A0E3M784_CLOSL|nr:KTSC domain-containing protein [Clostridium scatologenes]AKA68500.1 phage protein [Clostridium scatologenes]